MKPAKPCHLGGLSVLVTRPAEQANRLAESIEQAHGRPIRFPAIEIVGPVNKQAIQTAFNQLNEIDLLIFISANAVRYAFPLMPDNIPLNLAVAAIGQATAQALNEIGLEPDLIPDKNLNTEGLLALAELQQLNGKHISIVRGAGGRETLKQRLQERGAKVDYIEVYRRQRPQRKPANLVTHWQSMVDVVTVTSVEILHNLSAMLGTTGVDLLRATPLLVASERIAEQARELGCQHISIAQSALDQHLLEALCEMTG